MTPFRFISAQTKELSSGSTLNLDIPVGVRAVRVVSDIPVLFWYSYQTSAEAVLIPAGRPEYFLVQSPDSVVATAQKASDTGNVNIALLTR